MGVHVMIYVLFVTAQPHITIMRIYNNQTVKYHLVAQAITVRQMMIATSVDALIIHVKQMVVVVLSNQLRAFLHLEIMQLRQYVIIV
jgi:hypothetical protein